MTSTHRKPPAYVLTLNSPKGTDRIVFLAQSNAGTTTSGGILRPSSRASQDRRCRRCREWIVRDMKLLLARTLATKAMEAHPTATQRDIVHAVRERLAQELPAFIDAESGPGGIDDRVHPECDRCHGTGWESDVGSGFQTWTGIVLCSADAFWSFGDTVLVPTSALPGTEWILDVHEAFGLPDRTRPVLVGSREGYVPWAEGMAIVASSTHLPVWLRTGNWLESGRMTERKVLVEA